MNEKKKGGDGTESDKQFLDRCGATGQIRDAVAKLIENRPNDPITFLVNYFQSFDGGVDLTVKTYQQLTLTHYTAPTFDINVKIAYDIYSSKKILGKNIRGVTGGGLMDLMKLISRSYPRPVSETLLTKLTCYDSDAITFPVFKYAVFTCFVMQDYLHQADDLFSSLDVHGSGEIDQSLCDTVLQYLHHVISITDHSPQSVLEAGYMLRPDTMSADINKTLSTKSKTSIASTQTYSRDEFLQQAVDSFLEKVSLS